MDLNINAIITVKIYVAAVKALRTKERLGWNSIYHQKLVEKLVSVPVILVCKILKLNIKKRATKVY